MADVSSSIRFDIYDEETVRRLQEDDPDLLPSVNVNTEKDVSYNGGRITSATLTAILSGDSVDTMASNLVNTAMTSTYTQAVRWARTAMTAAQNGGRQSGYEQLEALGVTGLQKQWMATGDDRTRPSHMDVDGEIIGIDDTFSNGCNYPGEGPADEVWMCRCTMRLVIDGVNSSSASSYRESSVEKYQEWLEEKSAEKANKSYTSGAESSIINMGDTGFRSEELLDYHYEKHLSEFSGITKQGYLKKAQELANEPLSADVEQLARSDGSIAKYKYSTNEFVVINADGTIRTYFLPVDKEAYWEYEHTRNE